MVKYYEEFKFLIVATTVSGLYFPTIEKIYGPKWYIKIQKCIVIFPGFSLTIFFLFSIKLFFWDPLSLLNRLYSFAQLIYSFFSIFVIFAFYCRRNDIVKAFELWDTLFKDELYPEERQKLIQRNKNVTNNWLKIFGGLTMLSSLGYSVASYFNPEKKLDHPSGIPYRHQSPDFELVTTLELFITIFGFATLIAYDTVTMALLSLEEAQLAHLKNSLGRIIALLSVTNSGEIIMDNTKLNGNPALNEPQVSTQLDTGDYLNSNELFSVLEDRIRIWISHHLQVLRFHNEVQKIYEFSFNVKFFVFVILICFCSFLIVVGNFTLKDSVISIAFCCNNYALFYVNIRFADSIKNTGETMFEDAFGKMWHFYPRKYKSTFLIILLRSHRPVQYKAFRIYPLSSQSFLKILSTAYSFFTFLLHISRKKN